MTLISFIDGYGQPVIISDRAISDRGKLHKVVLPSTGMPAQVPTAVVEFQVKSVIIKDILCVAFAGGVLAIEKLLADTLDFYTHREVNSETLKELLYEIGPDPGCTVLYALGGPEFDRNRLMVRRYGIWVEDNSRENLYLLSAGNGASTWTPRVFEKTAYLENNAKDPRFGRQRALFAAMIFMNAERDTPEHLLDGWGGGFDIVYYQDGKFHRYDLVTYAFWQVDKGDLDQPKPVRFVNNSYLYGNVIVRNLGRSPGFYVVPGFGQTLPPLPPSYNCQSNDLVTCIRIWDGDEYIEDLVVLYHNPLPEHGVSFNASKADDGVMEYFIDDEYKYHLIQSVKQHLDIR